MKYKGIELKEITTPQVFDPPKKMLVWDNDVNCNEPSIQTVYAVIMKETGTKQAIGECCRWSHCANIPEEPKPRRVTERELTRWLAQGNGEYTNSESECWWASSSISYTKAKGGQQVDDCVLVRKWDDDEWHEPTVEYMGLENK